MDTSGAWLLHRTMRSLKQRGRSVQLRGLRPEFEALLQLIAAHDVAAQFGARPGLLARIGRQAWRSLSNAFGMLTFLGENASALLRCAARPRSIRWRAVAYNLQTTGFEALPITGLLSFLMGIVIAYQGAEQLRQFGANIYVADLVGLAMVRELSPMLTAIIVAGRSGSAYAAQIGTMKVTEEIDALETMALNPVHFLVTPKFLAMVVMMPCLTTWADFMGVLGGSLFGVTSAGFTLTSYIQASVDALYMRDIVTGLIKSVMFGMVITAVGCHEGFSTGAGAEEVGRSTTAAVVMSIFLVVCVDLVFTALFYFTGGNA